MIPDRIQKKLATRTLGVPRAEREVRVGDVRRAVSGGEERLIVVLSVQAQRETAQVTLVHSYPEYATSSDIIVDSSISGLTYSLVVQAGMRGVVWLKDLGRIVSEVPAEVVAACLAPRAVELAHPGLAVGTVYTGPLDARAEFKSRERESLARLCADSTTAALEGKTFELAVDEVFHALLAPSPHAHLMMSVIVDLYMTRGMDLVFTLEHVEFLQSRGLLDEARWEASLGPEGLSFRWGPLQQLIERAMARFGQSDETAQEILGERELALAGQKN